jgi:Arc/MetJ-type ribon-helix-helix transcriptional regulator
VVSLYIRNFQNSPVVRKRKMNLVTVKMSDIYVNGLDKLVEMGMYPSRSEAIRVAIRDLLRRELWPENGSPLIKKQDSE